MDVIFKVCKYILVKNRFACSSISSLFCSMDRYVVCDTDPRALNVARELACVAGVQRGEGVGGEGEMRNAKCDRGG